MPSKTTTPKETPDATNTPVITEEDTTSPHRSTRPRSSRLPIFVSQSAVNHVLSNAIEGNLPHTIPTKILKSRDPPISYMDPLDTVCCAVVHPITGEVITKYKTLAEDPVTLKIWHHAMCIELGRLSQEYDGT